MLNRPKVILVHGAWADASCWNQVVAFLSEEKITASALQLSLTSLEDDVAIVVAAIAREQSPVILVGHSYGGVVITEAGRAPQVAGLVYVAAFAPDIGQSAQTLTDRYPASLMNSELRADEDGVLTLTRAGVFEGFAQDLSDAQKLKLFEEQAPTAGAVLATAVSAAAWKQKPNWYLITTEDHAIPPDLQRELAKILAATTASIHSSHVPMLSQPRAVANLVLKAMESVQVERKIYVAIEDEAPRP